MCIQLALWFSLCLFILLIFILLFPLPHVSSPFSFPSSLLFLFSNYFPSSILQGLITHNSVCKVVPVGRHPLQLIMPIGPLQLIKYLLLSPGERKFFWKRFYETVTKPLSWYPPRINQPEHKILIKCDAHPSLVCEKCVQGGEEIGLLNTTYVQLYRASI